MISDAELGSPIVRNNLPRDYMEGQNVNSLADNEMGILQYRGDEYYGRDILPSSNSRVNRENSSTERSPSAQNKGIIDSNISRLPLPTQSHFNEASSGSVETWNEFQSETKGFYKGENSRVDAASDWQFYKNYQRDTRGN